MGVTSSGICRSGSPDYYKNKGRQRAIIYSPPKDLKRITLADIYDDEIETQTGEIKRRPKGDFFAKGMAIPYFKHVLSRKMEGSCPSRPFAEFIGGMSP